MRTGELMKIDYQCSNVPCTKTRKQKRAERTNQVLDVLTVFVAPVIVSSIVIMWLLSYV